MNYKIIKYVACIGLVSSGLMQQGLASITRRGLTDVISNFMQGTAVAFAPDLNTIYNEFSSIFINGTYVDMQQFLLRNQNNPSVNITPLTTETVLDLMNLSINVRRSVASIFERFHTFTSGIMTPLYNDLYQVLEDNGALEAIIPGSRYLDRPAIREFVQNFLFQHFNEVVSVIGAGNNSRFAQEYFGHEIIQAFAHLQPLQANEMHSLLNNSMNEHELTDGIFQILLESHRATEEQNGYQN